MKESDPKTLLDYLEKKYDSWYSTNDRKKRNFIEELVVQYIQNMDDSIYVEVNDGGAGGLCSFPNFERDLKKLILFLRSKL